MERARYLLQTLHTQGLAYSSLRVPPTRQDRVVPRSWHADQSQARGFEVPDRQVELLGNPFWSRPSNLEPRQRNEHNRVIRPARPSHRTFGYGTE